MREAFFEEYRQLDQKHVLLLFDTLEVASDAAIRFFVQTAPQLRSINPNTRLLVAGRKLPEDLADFDFVEKMELVGLTPANFSSYLSEVVKGRKITEDVIARVHTITNGRPMWAGLFADWINAGNEPAEIDTTSFEAFREDVLQPVRQLYEPEDTIILAMAHLSRRCNERILSHVLSELVEDLKIDIPRVVQNLSRFSFVKYREPIGDDLGSCLLHDEMRDLVRDYFWSGMDPFGDYRKNWSRKAVTYYTDVIKCHKVELPANTLDLQDLNAERLYYLLHVSPDEAFDFYLRLFSRARSTDVCEELNAEVSAAQEAFGFQLAPSLQRQYRLALAQVDHKRGRYIKAIEKFRELESDKDCEHELLASANWRHVMARTLNGEVPKAIAQGVEWERWLKTIIHDTPNNGDRHRMLNQQLASLYSQLGQAYRKQGVLGLARQYYEKALNLFGMFSDTPPDEIASTRVNLGFILHELGLDHEGEEQCNAALFTYEKIGDPHQLGRTHNVLGIIDDGMLRHDDAQEHFDKALLYFQEARSKRGQAMCQVAQARMIRQKQLYKGSSGLVVDGELEQSDIQVGKLLDAAIENLKEDDRALLAVALNEKGTLLRQQGRWNEAIQLFEESNVIAEKIGNDHRIADNLQDMAIAYYNTGHWRKQGVKNPMFWPGFSFSCQAARLGSLA